MKQVKRSISHNFFPCFVCFKQPASNSRVSNKRMVLVGQSAWLFVSMNSSTVCLTAQAHIAAIIAVTFAD